MNLLKFCRFRSQFSFNLTFFRCALKYESFRNYIHLFVVLLIILCTIKKIKRDFNGFLLHGEEFCNETIY